MIFGMEVLKSSIPGCERVGGDLGKSKEFIAFYCTRLVLWMIMNFSIFFAHLWSQAIYFSPSPNQREIFSHLV